MVNNLNKEGDRDSSQDVVVELELQENRNDPKVIKLKEVLGMAVEDLMLMGGDDRSVMKEMDGVWCNKYYCSKGPWKDGIMRSSSTCSNISNGGVEYVAGIQKEMMENLNWSLLEMKFDGVRNRIKKAFGWIDSKVILTPSGTDAEYIVTSVALGRCGVSCGKLQIVMTDSKEVGSGSALAASGRYFNTNTPNGSKVIAKEILKGFPTERIQMHELMFENGDYEQQVGDYLQRNFFKNDFVLLHAVLGSKTGRYGLSLEFLEKMMVK